MSELNLLPYSIKQKKMANLGLIQGLLVIILIAAILAAGAYLPYLKLVELRAEETSLKANVDKAKIAKIDNDKLKKETTLIKDYIDKVDNVKKFKTSVHPIVKNLEKYLPKDVVIKNFAYTKGTINITASCKNYDSIDEFVANLQETKEYSNSTVSNLSSVGVTDEFTFTLSILEAKGEVK